MSFRLPLLSAAFLGGTCLLHAAEEPMTAASLFWLTDPQTQVSYVEAANGNLFNELGHHGPAIENQWAGYRMYFNHNLSIDILSKFKPQLELAQSRWYANEALRAEGFGLDNFHVGPEIGLGGVRLWDGEKAVTAETNEKRFAQVIDGNGYAKIRMTTLGIPLAGEKVDLEVAITVFDTHRHAQVEIFVLSAEPVSLVTGLVTHDGLKVIQESDFLLSWGDYDSATARMAFDVGAAVLYNPDDFQRRQSVEKNHLVISKPTRYLTYLITTANALEESDLNQLAEFEAYVRNLSDQFDALVQ